MFCIFPQSDNFEPTFFNLIIFFKNGNLLIAGPLKLFYELWPKTTGLFNFIAVYALGVEVIPAE
jgi:hypothetical protein